MTQQIDRVLSLGKLPAGKILLRNYYNANNFVVVERQCPECNPLDGLDVDCNTCDGSGVITETERQDLLEDVVDVLVLEYMKPYIKKKMKSDRQELLNNGTLTSDGKFWFNEEWAKVFMTKVSSAESIGLTYVNWKDANGIVTQVDLIDAKAYVGEMIVILDKIYLG